MRLRLTFILFALTLANSARAELLLQPYNMVRPMGMGGAFLAISDDSNALWYNPAGLARVKEFHTNVIDTTFGADSVGTFSNLWSSIHSGQISNLLTSTQNFVRLNFKPTFVMPYFSVSLFSHATASGAASNLNAVNTATDIFQLLTDDPTIQLTAYNDIGLAAAFAIPMSSYASIGMTVRGFERTGANVNLSATQLLSGLVTIPTEQQLMQKAMAQVTQNTGAGWGVAFDAGLLATVPLPKGYPKWNLAAVVDDVGTTVFHNLYQTTPTTVPITYHAGTSLQYDVGKNAQFNLALDMRNFFQGYQLFKMTCLGLEYKHKYFALRGGVYQGYPTGGISIQFPPHTRIHFATYGMELGSQLWQVGQRIYMFQIAIGFNPD